MSLFSVVGAYCPVSSAMLLLYFADIDNVHQWSPSLLHENILERIIYCRCDIFWFMTSLAFVSQTYSCHFRVWINLMQYYFCLLQS